MNVFANINVYSLAAAGDENPVEDLLIRVWSVPAITITRRLDGIEVDEDNELITFREKGNTTNIFFRKEIQDHQQPMINFELAQYFSGQFEIEFEDANFLALLLSAQIDKLPTIMESHMENNNRSLPVECDNGESGSDSGESDSDDGESGSKAIAEGENPSPMEPSEFHSDEDGSEPEESNKDESGDDQLDVASESTDRQGEFENPSVFTLASIQYPQTLQELVPSHQFKAESVVRRAERFQISDSIAEPTATQHPRARGGFRHSLPIRIRNNHYDHGHSSSASQEKSTASSPGNLRLRNTSNPIVGTASSNISPLPSPIRSLAQVGVESAPAKEVSYREIGFKGEIFVLHA